MSKITNAIVTVSVVYGIAQVTVGSLMVQRIDAFAAELAASAPAADGTFGPVALRSSDICTLLTETDSWKGMVSRYAFIAPGHAADALTARYRFVATDGCSKYRLNMIVAQPRGH